ncbi:MAG: hypothetical protein JXQ29_00555 [Planctomycetes bacterium]|nr:hypothetical protein [Planctomycetota bacterium]
MIGPDDPRPAGPPASGPPRVASGVVVGLVLVSAFIAVNVWLVAAGRLRDGATGRVLATLDGLGIMLAAGLTLAILSFLWRDNPLFKLAEHLFLGVSVGYGITIAVHQYLRKQLWVPLVEPILHPGRAEQAPQWALLVPVVLGLCLLARFVPRAAWLSRYAFAMMVGWAAGLMVPYVIYSYVYKQTAASLVAVGRGPTLAGELSNLVALAGVLSVLVYFVYSVRRRGLLRRTAQVGLLFLMVSFGATFGFTVMARISLLTGRAMFLLTDWLHVIDP